MDYNTIILKFRNNCLGFITARLWKLSLPDFVTDLQSFERYGEHNHSE